MNFYLKLTKKTTDFCIIPAYLPKASAEIVLKNIFAKFHFLLTLFHPILWEKTSISQQMFYENIQKRQIFYAK